MIELKGGETMKVVLRFTKREELKALPILLRHSPGMVLRNRTYIIAEEAARALREAGIKFTEITREATAPSRNSEGVISGERI